MPHITKWNATRFDCSHSNQEKSLVNDWDFQISENILPMCDLRLIECNHLRLLIELKDYGQI